MVKTVYGGIMWVLLVSGIYSCNPSKQINKAVADRNKQEPKVIYPSKHIATPPGINYVYDYENLFTPQQEKKLDTLLRNFETSNLIPIKLNTVNNTLAASGIEAYNVNDLKEWDNLHGRSSKAMVFTISKSLNQTSVNYGDFAKKFLSKEELSQIVNADYAITDNNNSYFETTYKKLTGIMDAIRHNINFNPSPISK